MKNSSAVQLELEYSGVPGSSDETPDMVPKRVLVGGDKTATTSLKFAESDELTPIYAITAKRAGRLNASKTTTQEHESLLRERQNLLDKQFAGTISKKESNRLEYVRWSLDRIEDAQYGEALDTLEAAVSQYERIENQLQDLHVQLEKAVSNERAGRRQAGRRR
jgi:hypothetical protein